MHKNKKGFVIKFYFENKACNYNYKMIYYLKEPVFNYC